MPRLLDRLLGRGVKPPIRSSLKIPLRGRYDGAQTTDDNRRHWAAADALSAGAAAVPGVRRTLRMRSRYEVANNAYARGVVSTLANDTIGTGVRLQMATPDGDANNLIEEVFSEWAQAVCLASKLRTMRMAKTQDGEVFGILTSNPRLPTDIKLDLRLIEADQVANPWTVATMRSMSDGIEFDAWGNPIGYWVLRHHPGDLFTMGAYESDLVPAEAVIHYFRTDRPGQLRGIPEITPALGLFAQLRRYTSAVLAAAEVAADQSLVIYTDAPANGESDAMVPMDTIELEKRMATVMPGGWKLGQAKAEQPTTTYGDFKHEILNEIGRCLNMPLNVVLANSSSYNYASGRLDHQVYFKSIRVEQAAIEHVILERVFAAWFAEAVLIEGLLPQSLRRVDAKPSHQWFWDGQEHVDPMKEATAQGERLLNHTTTLAEEYAKRGKDWEAEIRQAGVEAALLKELDLAVPTRLAPAPAGAPGD